MAGAEPDLRNMHFDHTMPVVRAASRMETAAARTLVGVQDRLDLGDGFFCEMIDFEEHGAVSAFKLAIKFEHHLATPVVAFDEAVALRVGGVAAKRSCDVGAGRSIVILDERIDLETLEVSEGRAGMKGHGIAVAAIGRVFVRAEEIA